MPRPARTSTRFGRSRQVVATVLGAALAVALVASADAKQADMERGSKFFDAINVAGGSFTPTSQRSYQGSRSGLARYHGGGGNGYARGQFEVSWPVGSTVVYRAAFYLPRGFYGAMQGQVGLMRWDNWTAHGSDGDVGGIVVYDGRARLVRGNYRGLQEEVGRPFRLPVGRWFTLTVKQRFSTANPRSRVRVGRRTVVSSSERNFGGRGIQMIRYGIVSMAPGKQQKPLHLWIDKAAAHRG
jgi:hypothetical protein